ncbi:MAG: molybdate ABC transporter substrate-binding protein [Porticoccaceae bacterium]|nr:MAG: molybdate ABC transporter substrate-binding protein [Porticoccaceae bacterium]
MARIALWMLCLLPPLAWGETARVAVAANFAATFATLADRFAATGHHRVVASPGATGKLVAQILHGAPFDLLLAADEASVDLLVARGRVRPQDRYVYAEGILVLWSADSRRSPSPELLQDPALQRVALPNPRHSPYGRAALAALGRLAPGRGDLEHLYGESVAQTLVFVERGGAPVGFVALAQVGDAGGVARGSGYLVPAAFHPPLRQTAALLERGRRNPAALAFWEFLRGAEARRVIEAAGYRRGEAG